MRRAVEATGRVLDRVPSRPDPRRATLYSAAQAQLVDPRGPRSYSWPVPFVLDQGREGACVGHAVTLEAVAKPRPVRFDLHRNAGTLPSWAGRTMQESPRGDAQPAAQRFAFDAYDRARDVDWWPGRDYEGTSPDAGAKAMREAGLWGGWRWTTDAYEAAVVVSRVGPVVLGVDWHTGMMRPDAAGYLHPTGMVEGGHAILARGYSLRRRAFLLTNSWGQDWGFRTPDGIGGNAWLLREDLQQLIAARGEVCIPVGRKL